ncbi:Uncharacterised protein [Mycobacteroides abscessus subsp. massiliense]|nr:Uncharacterised protein [Mycobacteroides abscessus subsp. massiliense]
MRCAACAGNDGFDAAFACGFGVFKHQIRRTVCRDDTRFVFNAEFFEKLCCLLHHRPIAVAAHNNADLDHEEFLLLEWIKGKKYSDGLGDDKAV